LISDFNFTGRFRVALRLLLLFIWIPGSILSTGCDPTVKSASRHRRNTATVSGSRRDDLARTLELLDRLDLYDLQEARRQALFNLERWGAKQTADKNWTVDKILDQLPARLSRVNRDVKLTSVDFNEDDIEFLLENTLLREIARFVSEESKLDPLVLNWLENSSSELSNEELRDLSLAARLFDWTIRNIQLEESRPLVRKPKLVAGPAPAPRNNPQKTESRDPLSVGPGEMFTVGETLLTGLGDSLDRARLFILLSRQLGLQAVLLAVEENNYFEPRPWLCGVLIQQKLYLFDTRLGLPVPRLDGAGIASLQEVLAEPAILRQLDLEEEPYWVRDRDVRRVVGLIDASPRALSFRMQKIEQQLAGDRKMKLTVAATPLAERIRTCPGIKKVQLSLLPFERLRFRRNLQRHLKKDDKIPNPVAGKMFFIETMTPLYRARILHFRSQFDDQPQRQGARSYYLSSRPPDRLIQRLATDPSTQVKWKLDKLTSRERTIRLHYIERAKQAASYWLGLLCYEAHDYIVARDYFETRTMAASPQGPWSSGARYNLARTFEMLDQANKAVKLNTADQSPQRHGNLLRAKFLDQAVARRSSQ